MAYGLPYKGSKNTIREFVFNTIYKQPLETGKKYTDFYDVFGGGGAITHMMLEKSDIPHIHMNDVLCTPELFKWFATDTYNEHLSQPLEDYLLIDKKEYCLRWGDKKALNPELLFITLLYTFGSQLSYTYGYCDEKASRQLFYNKQLIEYIHKEHMTLEDVFKQDNITAFLNKHIFDSKADKDLKDTIRVSQRMQRCIYIATSLKDKNVGERLICTQKDYRELDIKDGSLVYLDPPYENTTGYNYGKHCRKEQKNFDYAEFYKWCEDLSDRCDVYLSSLQAPEHWDVVAERISRFSFGQKEKAVKTLERIYRPRKAK